MLNYADDLKLYSVSKCRGQLFQCWCHERLQVGTPSVVACLTLKVLVTTIDAQWDGMGDVGSARYEPDHKGFKLQ